VAALPPSANGAADLPVRAFADQPDFWAAFAHAATGMMIADLKGHFIYANPAYCAMLGYTEAELKLRSVRELTHPDDVADTQFMARRLLAGEFPGYVVERRYLHANGTQIWVRNSMSAVRDGTGQAVAMLAIAEDVTAGKHAETERSRAEAALRTSEERLTLALEVTGLGTWDYDVATGVTVWSERMETLYGLKAGTYVQRLDMFTNFVHPEDRERVTGVAAQAFINKTDYALEYRTAQPHADGSPRWLASQCHLSFDADGRILRAVGTVLDITERKLAEQALQHQAFHDTLTGLPNRALFIDRLEHALLRADRQGNSVALLFVDLDNFKLVNDSLGHAQGDALLMIVAERLRACLRSADTGARLGGDEFTVLLEDVSGEAEALAVAERIAAALCTPVVLQGREIVVSASIGVALGPTGAGQDLLRDADLAMYRAKSNGKSRCEMFNPACQNSAPELGAGDSGPVDHGAELGEDDIGVDHGGPGEGAETAVGAGDDVFAADELGIADQPLSNELRVLDVVGGGVQHTWDEYLIRW
jgi:diguanylate cyclase (GGDEF)-like protein/PAS domain S-box-containing protein